MFQIIIMIHVFIALSIIALVLVQQGKGATVGAAFGSGASQTIFGSRGSGSFLFRLTISLGAIFFATSIFLNYIVMQSYKQSRNTAPLTSLQTPVNKIPNTTAPSIPAAPTIPAPSSPKETSTSPTVPAQPSPSDIPVPK